MNETDKLMVRVTRIPGSNLEADVAISELTRTCDWTRQVKVGRGEQFLNFYVLKAQMPHDRARELHIASDEHANMASVANVYVMESPNKANKEGYKYLCKLAGPRPKVRIARPQGEPPCTKRVLDILSEEPLTRGEVRTLLLNIGYDADTIIRAIKSLEKKGRIAVQPHGNPQKQILSITTDK